MLGLSFELSIDEAEKDIDINKSDGVLLKRDNKNLDCDEKKLSPNLT
jgi:hypothetical protein